MFLAIDKLVVFGIKKIRKLKLGIFMTDGLHVMF